MNLFLKKLKKNYNFELRLIFFFFENFIFRLYALKIIVLFKIDRDRER
jgi:hypothetical protein